MKLNILIVDDQAFIRHIITSELKKNGFEVFDAVNGKKAIEFLTKTNINIDLILLDAMMPELDGFETCKYLKSNEFTKKIPIIFLTANADKQSVIKAVQAGGNDFFVKGQNTQSLINKIYSITDKG